MTALLERDIKTLIDEGFSEVKRPATIINSIEINDSQFGSIYLPTIFINYTIKNGTQKRKAIRIGNIELSGMFAYIGFCSKNDGTAETLAEYYAKDVFKAYHKNSDVVTMLEDDAHIGAELLAKM